MGILTVKDEEGNIVEIPAIKGKDGKDGKDAETDQTYNPTSENAQSGVAIHGLIGDLPEDSPTGEKPENVISLIYMIYGAFVSRISDEYQPNSQAAMSGIAVAQALEQSVGDIDTALDEIISLQASYINEDLIGGASE